MSDRAQRVEFDREVQAHRAAQELIAKLDPVAGVPRHDMLLEVVEQQKRLAAAARMKRLVDLVSGWPRGMPSIEIYQSEEPLKVGASDATARISWAAFDPPAIIERAAKDWFTEEEIDRLENSVREWRRRYG